MFRDKKKREIRIYKIKNSRCAHTWNKIPTHVAFSNRIDCPFGTEQNKNDRDRQTGRTEEKILKYNRN